LAGTQSYKGRTEHFLELLLVAPLYSTRGNRKYLKQKGIHFAGKPLGQPKKVTDQNRAELKQEKKQQREDYRQRIPMEGKFGHVKNSYQL
jgi:IS5 family transposase